MHINSGVSKTLTRRATLRLQLIYIYIYIFLQKQEHRVKKMYTLQKSQHSFTTYSQHISMKSTFF